MITYNWNCKTVDVHPVEGGHTDVVYNVHWIVTGESDDSYSGRSIGTQILDTSTIGEFIPFSDLTNDQVVEWTKQAMGAERVAEIEAGIAEQIAIATDPPSITMIVGE